MHPLEKILLLTAIYQVLQMLYLVWFVHDAHVGTSARYMAKMLPLFVAEAYFVVLILRLIHAIPFIGI